MLVSTVCLCFDALICGDMVISLGRYCQGLDSRTSSWCHRELLDIKKKSILLVPIKYQKRSVICEKVKEMHRK